MKKNKANIVFTTIFDPTVLDDLYFNFKKYDHLDEVTIYVIPDKKTPSTAYERCLDLNKKGVKTFCPTLEEQEIFLKKVGFPPVLIPHNSDNRRNVGFLMALENGNEFLISIDDDNFCQNDEDFFKEHEIVCTQSTRQQIVKTKNGWFNICEQLEFEPTIKVYPRGFPYFARHKETNVEDFKSEVKIKINQGLWLMDPDIDGISWLVNPGKVKSFRNQSIVLDKNTWSPINTQNTSLSRDVIPAYYFIKMGYPLAGTSIDRYGDIFSGYFVETCIKNTGDSIRFGTPIVLHKRNSHNYLNDASNEWACIMVLEELLAWIKEVKLEGKDYCELYLHLSTSIEEAVESFKGKIWSDATRGFFHQIAFYMRKWINSVKIILGN